VGKTDDFESMRSLRQALELGINYFDTAFAYGHGHSERLIARLRKESGVDFVVSTKIPPKNMEWPARRTTRLEVAFPPDWIRLCVDRSLRNLSADCSPFINSTFGPTPGSRIRCGRRSRRLSPI